jgi:hypothetical protein
LNAPTQATFELRGMVSMFTQRIGNLEIDAASTNMKLHELQKTSQTQDDGEQQK